MVFTLSIDPVKLKAIKTLAVENFMDFLNKFSNLYWAK